MFLRLGDLVLDFILNGVYFGVGLFLRPGDFSLDLLDVSFDAKLSLLDCLFDTLGVLCDVFLDLLNDALEIIVLLKLVVVCMGHDDVVESGFSFEN